MAHERFDRQLGIWLPIEEWYARRAVDPTDRSPLPCPNVMGDIAEYKSPLGTGVIGSRSHRREDLKRGNCREVDPSEYQHPPVKPRAKWLNAQAGAH